MLQQMFRTAIHAEIENIVRQHLDAFAQGDFDTWGAQLAPDVFFTAADPEEVFSNHEAAIAEMHRDFDPAFDDGLKIEIQPQSFHIGSSADGSAAWIATPLEYTVSFGEESISFVLRHTDVLAKSDDQWSILATHYSLALAEAKVLQALSTGQLPAPRMPGDSAGPGAEELIEQFARQLVDLSKASISHSCYAFGPLPGEQAEGETAVRRLLATLTSRWGELYLRPDGIRAELLANAEVGWVGANIDARLKPSHPDIAIPLRALVIYQKEQGIWTIVHAHISIGIPDELAE